MRLRISKRNKNNVSPVTEERLPDRNGKLRPVEKQILDSLYKDYPISYDLFNWFPESDIVNVLKSIITKRHITETNTLVLGRPGWGKSDSIKTLAKDLGLKYHKIMLKHHQPEDLAGIPRIVNISSVNDLTDLPGDWETRSDSEKADYRKIVLSSPSVTAATPAWMKKTLLDALDGKKTIWFFDEINTAREDVITAAFEVILSKEIQGVTNNLSLENYVYVIAAGNFSTDNEDVKILSDPAMARFTNKIAIAEDWNSGLKAAYKSWSDKNSGLDKDIVAIVDTIMTDPEFKRRIVENNDTVADFKMGGKTKQLVGREVVLSPRHLTKLVISGIYQAASAYYYSPSKDSGIIQDILEGVGDDTGYNFPNALLQYCMNKIPNVSAPSATGTSMGKMLDSLDEALDLAEEWVKERQIPKAATPLRKMTKVVGLNSADIQTDIESIINALKEDSKFTEITPEGWDTVANKIRPLLEEIAGPPETIGKIQV